MGKILKLIHATLAVFTCQTYDGCLDYSSGVNIGDIIRNDMEFSDSKTNLSVQISDLLASGVLRYLRHGFSDNKVATQLLGRLMLGNEKNKFPIKFIGFGTQASTVDDSVSEIVYTMDVVSSGLLLNA